MKKWRGISRLSAKGLLRKHPDLKILVQLLLQYEPERIILFGSQARGEADSHSDYDLVVIKRTDQPFLERLKDMVPFIRDFGYPVQILVYTPEEFDNMQETGLGWVIRQEGVVLFESSAT